MAVDIIIDVRDVRWKAALRPHKKTVETTCHAALAACKVRRGEMAVVLAHDAFVQQLNATYRAKDKPTNVLSFVGEADSLGDVVLAFETTMQEAKDQGKTFKNHVQHLIVHGILHLLGHNHMKQHEAEKMEALEIKVLKKLGVANPYL